MNDFLFNFSFTRPDEQNANTYHVGMHVEAATREEAERKLRERNDHLTITSVELYAVMNEDGDLLTAPCRGCAVEPAIRTREACEFCGGTGVVELDEPRSRFDDSCPGCGCEPGDGVTAGCNHPDGCGFFAEMGGAL